MILSSNKPSTNVVHTPELKVLKKKKNSSTTKRRIDTQVYKHIQTKQKHKISRRLFTRKKSNHKNQMCYDCRTKCYVYIKTRYSTRLAANNKNTLLKDD